MANSTPLLQLQAITASYDSDELAVDDVSLEVAQGEVVGLVSLDMGGGKTTLLKVAAGLHKPDSGSVRFKGKDVYAMGFGADQRYRRECAVVLEGGALLVNLSVWENVALPLRYHGTMRGRELKVTVERLLAQCGFNENPHALPWQVSDRGQRLAAFARALARNPSLVFVDRFFEGLEMPDWRRLFELVMELNQNEGVTWVLISELDPAIFQVAERVAVLEEGRLVDYDYRRNLYKQVRLRAAFEAAEVRPMRTRTQRADRDRIRAIAGASSSGPNSLVVESSAESLLSSDDLGATLYIDGVLPTAAPPTDGPSGRRGKRPLIPDLDTTLYIPPGDTPPVEPPADPPPRRRRRAPLDPNLAATVFVEGVNPPSEPRGEQTVEMEAPILDDEGELTITIDGIIPSPPSETSLSGEDHSGISLDEDGHPTIFVGSSDVHLPLPSSAPSRPAAPTVEMAAPELPESDEGEPLPPGRVVAPTVALGPPISEDEPAEEKPAKKPVSLSPPKKGKKATGKTKRARTKSKTTKSKTTKSKTTKSKTTKKKKSKKQRADQLREDEEA
jgi:D-methionine transport system ATP-binding protein